MAQVTLLEGKRMPMLTAFGRLGGGPSEFGEGEVVILALESAHQGSNGAMMIEREHFRDAVMPSENGMVIRYGSCVQIVLTASSDD